MKSPKPRWQLMSFVWMALLLLQGSLLILEKDWISWILGRGQSNQMTEGVIAQVIPKSGETLLQRRGDFVWNPAQNQQPLARRDGVLTGEEAQSELVFEDGLTLLLGPRTWIEVDRAPSGNGTRVRLRHGLVRMTRSTSAPLSIEFGGGTVEVAPQALVDLDEGKLHVRSGEAVLNRAHAPAIRVTRSESVTFEPGSAEVGVNSPLLAITDPDTEGTVSSESLAITWTVQRRSPLEAPMRVQLSRSLAFGTGDLIAERTVPLSEPVPKLLKTTLTLGAISGATIKAKDLVYLRIVSRNQGKDIASPTVKLRWGIESPSLPDVKLPKSPPPPPPEDFDLEIKKNAPKKSGTKKRSDAWLRFFAELRWAMGIPEAEAEDANSSSTSEAEMPPTEIVEGEDAQVTVKWRPVEGAATYRVQASDGESFVQIAAEETVSEPQWKWSPPPFMLKGLLFFRVASMSADGQVGGFSRPRKIALPIILPPPAFSFGAQLHTGLGNFAQTGGNSGLSTVQGVAPYFQQKLAAEFRLARENDQFALEIAGTLASFHKPNTVPTTLQPDAITGALSSTLLRHSAARRNQTPWSWAVGLSADWNYRWYKLSAQILEPRHAFALGPAGSIMRNWGAGELGWARLIPRSSEFKLRLPLSGLLTQGNWGFAASAAAEWKIYSRKRIHLSLRAESEMAWTRFQDGSGSSVFAWVFWLAPVFHWGSP